MNRSKAAHPGALKGVGAASKDLAAELTTAPHHQRPPWAQAAYLLHFLTCFFAVLIWNNARELANPGNHDCYGARDQIVIAMSVWEFGS